MNKPVIRNFKFIFVFLIMFPMLCLAGSCKESTSERLNSMKRPILPESMMKGYKLDISIIYPKDKEDLGQSYQEIWIRKENTGVIVLGVTILDKREYAEPFALQTARRWKDADYFKKGFGEKYWVHLSESAKTKNYHIINPISLVFIKGNAVVEVSGRGYYGHPPSESREFFEKVARYIESKI